MPQCTRIFIAIAVPEPLERELVRLQAELALEAPGCRWTSALPFHVTLAFLGDVPNSDLDDVHQAAAASADAIEPFDVAFTGLGAFPSPGRPRVIWAGVTAHNTKPLFELQSCLVNSLGRIGHRPDDERFHPHVTLGRIKRQRNSPGDLTGLIQRYSPWSAGQWTIAEVQVFASTLGPTGSAYSVLGRSPLNGEKTEGRA
jgi:RNA 2',3'-cyclic 3'-phosphodiesterase